MDASTLVVPLWPAIAVSGGILTTIIGIVVWTISNFERKADAISTNNMLEQRVSKMETSIDAMSRDVSYIRGWLEKGSGHDAS